jgi:hypothetical protein
MGGQGGQGKSGGPPVENRWWVDQGKARERAARAPLGDEVAGAAFFRVGRDYDQERARTRLTDLNLKLLEEGNPPPGGWGYLQMTPERFAEKTRERIKRAIPLPPGARALAVDSGTSLRIILTSETTGERLIELRFGDESSFDAWVHGEWVAEALFRNLEEALRAAPAFVTEHFTGSHGEEFR